MKNITIDYTNIMNPTDNSRFLNDHDFESIRKDIETIQKQIQSERETNEALHFLSLPNAYDKRYSKTVFGNVLIDAKSQIDSRTKQIRNNFSDYVQIAIGGSALGSIALVDALGEGPVNVHLPDNIDPEWIASILDKIDPQRTILNIISKSGGTVETLSTFFIFYEELKKKVATMFTDPQRQRKSDPGRPELCNVYTLQGLYSTPEDVMEIAAGCRSAAIGCTECKRRLAAAIAEGMRPIHEKREHYLAHPEEVRGIIEDGNIRAGRIAAETLAEVREAMKIEHEL